MAGRFPASGLPVTILETPGRWDRRRAPIRGEGRNTLSREEHSSPLRDLYLVRHGATAWNLEETKRYQGSKDIPLSREGRTQASAVATFFAGLPVSAIFSSPLRRALETAKRIEDCKGSVAVQVVKSLREMGFGEWEGKSPAEIDAVHGDLRARWIEAPHSTSIPGAEPMQSLFSRAEASLTDVLSVPGECHVVVSHGALLRAVTVVLLDLPESHLNRVELNPGAITAFRISEKGAELTFENLDPQVSPRR